MTRLNHDAVAARDRSDHRPEGEQGRVVPRTHHQHDAERVALVRVRVRLGLGIGIGFGFRVS